MSSSRILSFLPLLLLALSCATSGVAIRDGLPASVSGRVSGEWRAQARDTSIADGTPTQEHDAKGARTARRSGRSRSSMQLLLGGRHLSDGGLWAPVEDQVVIGSEFDWIAAGSVLGFEIGFQASFGSETEEAGVVSIDQAGSALELYGGPRFDTALFGSSIHLLAGAGPSLLRADRSQEINGSLRSDSEGSLGIYAHAGLMLDLGDIGLGLDYRLRWGQDMTGFEDVFGTSRTGDADYGQLALTLSLLF